MSSVYIVCWIFLQTFQTYFCIQANSVDPDQTAPRTAVWSGSSLFAIMTFKLNHKQVTKQTIVVIGSLRVKTILIPTQKSDNNLEPPDESRGNSKQNLYFNKSTGQDSWNFVLCRDF